MNLMRLHFARRREHKFCSNANLWKLIQFLETSSHFFQHFSESPVIFLCESLRFPMIC